MSPRFWTVAAVLFAHAAVALAQDGEDDLLAPLTPVDKGKKKKKEKEKKESPKAPPAAPAVAKLLVKLPEVLSGVVTNAKVFVDNNEVATLPMEQLVLPPGEHKISVKRPGYSVFISTVKIKAGAVNEVIAKIEAVAGVLSVSSEVVGAEVFVDGQSQGPVPVSEVLLKPGEHELRVRREHYDDHVQALSVKPGRDYPLKINLTPVAASATTTVAARPATDRPERVVPKVEPVKKPEPVVASRAPTALPPAATASTTRQRDDDPGLFGSWYFWAGAGAVAVGGAVTAVVIANQPPWCIPGSDGKCFDTSIGGTPGTTERCRDGSCFSLPVLHIGGALPR